MKEMLQTNGDCELPCWWGVVPGQSDWQSVRDHFLCWGVSEGVVPGQPGFVGSLSLVVGNDYYVNNLFLIEDGRVQSVKIISGWLSDPPNHTEHFAADWRRYSLDQVLHRYGQPSQVLLSLGTGEFGPLYNLMVLYDHLGIAVSYLGLATADESGIHACPAWGKVWHIYLWLQSPAEETSLLECVFDRPEDMASFRPLEEATGMSVETFYKTFSNPDSGVCLEERSPTLP